MEPSPAPTFLYKILPPDSPPPSPLPKRLAPTALDATDGFIHLSTAAQVPLTAQLFFANAPTLYLLKLKLGSLDGRIEWTTDQQHGGVKHGCPHVFDSVAGLGRASVVSVIHVARPDEQDWSQNRVLRALES